MQLPETEHFRIEHRSYATHHPYAVLAKPEKTKDSRALVPMPATANSPDQLIDALLHTEAWYVKNRYGIDRKAVLLPRASGAA